MAIKGEVTDVTERAQVTIPAEKVTAAELRRVVPPAQKPLGTEAMRGFARRFREEPRGSDDWMRENREGER